MSYAPPSDLTSPERVRQEIVDSLHRTFEGFDGGLKMFPAFLIEAIENRVWEFPRQLNMSMVAPMTFREFIHASYPRGLGADFPTVERFISHDERAMLAWDCVVQRPDGNPTGTNQYKADGTLDNIQGSSTITAPTGTSAQAGIRRLRKAADSGDEHASDLLAKVIDHTSDMSVHRACKEMGWRKDVPPLKAVQAAWRKADQEQREEIAAWFSKHVLGGVA